MTDPTVAPESDPAPEPYLAFDNSRRLTGPNRHFDGPAATLTAQGPAAADPAALRAWEGRVRDLATGLGWPDPDPQIDVRPGETALVFRAPQDAQITATDLNEWAWQRAAVDAGDTRVEWAHDWGDDPRQALAERAAQERIAGLSALRAAAADHSLPWFEDDETISVGAGAGSRCWPRQAPPTVEAVPWDDLHDVPTALVTGSNGKTTTVRLLAAIAAQAGLTPGWCCTEGVFVGAAQGGATPRGEARRGASPGAAVETVAFGDYSGPDGARTVLRDPRVQAAVLETARGGILRRGLAVRRADVAVVTNIRADHFGEYGINSEADLADTKLVVARAVAQGGTLVLNADDPVLMTAAARLPHARAARRALFAADHDHPELSALRSRGGMTCGTREGDLLLTRGAHSTSLGAVAALPLTVDGAAGYNLANLAAAALAAVAMGLPEAAILQTFARFGADPGDNPGRLERWTHCGATVLIDYAHNPDALSQLLTTARALRPQRLLLLLGQAGNRGNEAMAQLARTVAGFQPDAVVLKELPLMLRGRQPGEVTALLESGLRDAGFDPRRIRRVPDEAAAARGLLAEARTGDVIVLPVHTRAVREGLHALLRAAGVG